MLPLLLLTNAAGKDALQSTHGAARRSIQGGNGELVLWSITQERSLAGPRQTVLTVTVNVAAVQPLVASVGRHLRVSMLVLMWHHAAKRPNVESGSSWANGWQRHSEVQSHLGKNGVVHGQRQLVDDSSSAEVWYVRSCNCDDLQQDTTVMVSSWTQDVTYPSRIIRVQSKLQTLYRKNTFRVCGKAYYMLQSRRPTVGCFVGSGWFTMLLLELLLLLLARQ